jgi:hypothetical protein
MVFTDKEIADLNTWANDPRMTRAIRNWLTVDHAWSIKQGITRNDILRAIRRKVGVSQRVAETLLRIEEDSWDSADLHPLTHSAPSLEA